MQNLLCRTNRSLSLVSAINSFLPYDSLKLLRHFPGSWSGKLTKTTGHRSFPLGRADGLIRFEHYGRFKVWRLLKKSAHALPFLSSSVGAFLNVKSEIFTPFSTCFQVRGIETVACGFARVV